MTRNTRQVIFYVLVALFFLIGAAVVLYAQGWRLDTGTLRATKVGAIYVRSFPKNAQIYLDGKAVQNRSGLLSPGTLVSDLFPRTYNLVLKSDGYHDWQESAGVTASLVTEFKYAVLVPKNATTVATSTVKNFSLVSSEMLLTSTNNAITWRGRTIGSGEVISRSSELKNIVIKSSKTGAYLLYDFDKSTSINISAILTASGINPQNITSVNIDPYDATELVVKGIQRIWLFDAARPAGAQDALTLLERTSSTAVRLGPSVAISPSLVAWTDSATSSRLVLYDKFSKTIAKSSSTVPGTNVELKWAKGNILGVLQNDGSLYLYDKNADTFEKLADDVKSFEPTSDGSLIAAIEHSSLEIFSFTDAETYHRFNLPNIANASSLIWYKDMGHLFVVYKDHVSFLDVDDLGLKNFTPVANGTAPFYDTKTNGLYFVNPSGLLLRLTFPA